MSYRAPTVLPRHLLVRNLVRRIARMAESVGTVLILLLISGAVLPLILHDGPRWPDISPPSAIERVCYWLSYLFLLLQVISRPRDLLRTAIHNPFVPGVAFIALLSVAWSDDPSTSLRDAGVLSMRTLFGLYLASRYSTKELLQHLGVALGIVAVLSLVLGLVAPDYGLEGSFRGGAWRGAFPTKNVLGETMVLAGIVFWLLSRIPGGGRRAATVMAILAVGLVVLARATGAIVILAALLIIMPVVRGFRRGGAASVLALSGLLVASAVASVAIAERQPVLNALGKDATLTGRTVLWAAVEEHITRRPLLGYGYGAFWEPAGRASEMVRAVVGWDTPHSHNGFLDLWLDIGLVGLLVFLAAYVLAIRRAWVALRAGAGIDGLWAMAFLVMLLLGNLTESSIYQNDIFWLVFVAVAGVNLLLVPEDEMTTARSKVVRANYGRA